jgi:two-component system chemotaxis response regulator CheY
MAIKVLIADDALFMRNMIRDIFSQETVKDQYEVVGEASNGVEVVELFNELKPDLVTMDIVMPLKSGIEATREIISKNPDAKIVMCSALGQEPLVMEAIEAGASEFIIKPFQADDVLKKVNAVLGK